MGVWSEQVVFKHTDLAEWQGSGFQIRQQRFDSFGLCHNPCVVQWPRRRSASAKIPVQFRTRGSLFSRSRLAEGRLATNQEIAGSNPAFEAISCRDSSVERASVSGAEGRRFEPSLRRHVPRQLDRTSTAFLMRRLPVRAWLWMPFSAAVAQPDEQRFSKSRDRGSSPLCRATFHSTDHMRFRYVHSRVNFPLWSTSENGADMRDVDHDDLAYRLGLISR